MSASAKREINVGLIVVALALLSIFVVIPSGVVVPESIDIAVMSPDFWPLVVSIAAGLAGVFVTLGGVIELKRADKNGPEHSPMDETLPIELEGDEYRPFGEATLRVVVTVGVLLALYFLVPFIGIVVGTMVMLVILIRFSGETRWKFIIPIAIILPSLLYVFFVYVANIPMPIGIFEQFR